jgi:pimeloyl-ACP methyl ester carboxylesterase
MADISFREEGKGKAVLLLHGFPMTSGIWNKFSAALSASFRIITIDLPGFGNSTLPSLPITLDAVADIILKSIDGHGIVEVIPIGHSLGGYIVLSMVSKRPDLFPGFGLFHSTAMPDSREKKASRNKVIEFIRKNGAEAFTTNFITPLFANSHHPDVPFVREMNIRTNASTLIAYAEAMRDRPGHMTLISQYKRPILFITGVKDPGIPVQDIREQASIARQPELHVLEDQSHMGLIEDVATTSSIVYDFVKRCYE